MRERERERSNAAIDKRQEPPPCQRRWGKKKYQEKRVGHVGRLYCECFYLYLLLLLDIYLHPQERSHPGRGDWDNRERTNYVSTLSRNRDSRHCRQLCVCNFWFVRSTYKKGGSFIISTLSYSFSTSWLDSMRTDKKIRKEAKISLKLLTYFISSFVYFVVFMMLFSFLLCCLFFVCATMSSSCLMMEDVDDDSITPAALPSLFFSNSFFFISSSLFGCTSRRHGVCKQTPHDENRIFIMRIFPSSEMITQ